MNDFVRQTCMLIRHDAMVEAREDGVGKWLRRAAYVAVPSSLALTKTGRRISGHAIQAGAKGVSAAARMAKNAAKGAYEPTKNNVKGAYGAAKNAAKGGVNAVENFGADLVKNNQPDPPQEKKPENN